jgi:hypothetical protein
MPTTIERSCGALALTVTGCTGNGVSPIVLTVSGYMGGVKVGQRIVVASVGGNTNANGGKTVTAVGSNTITFAGTGNGNYTSGGTVARDYATFDAWNTATRTYDLVGNDQILRLWLCNDTIGRAVGFPTPSAAINNPDVDTTRYRIVQAWPDNRFDPFERSGAFIWRNPLEATPYILKIEERNFRVVGCGIRTDPSSSPAPTVDFTTGSTTDASSTSHKCVSR